MHDTSVCTTELIGIRKALETVAESPPSKVSILRDSLASVRTLGNVERGKMTDIKDEILAQSTNHRNLECQVSRAWNSAHKGIPGNEKEDRPNRALPVAA